MGLRIRRAAASLATAAAAVVAVAAPFDGGTAVRASRAEGGAPSSGQSYEGTASNNGRFVAYYGGDDVLDHGFPDTNEASDVLLVDMRTGALELISANEDGEAADGDSYYPALSANGRWVLFRTNAPELTGDVANEGWHLVLRDRKRGTVVPVTVTPDGAPADEDTEIYQCRPLSGNGRWAVFASQATNLVEGDTNGVSDVFLADLRRGTLRRIPGLAGETDGASYYPSISPNGRWIVFVSAAMNLHADDTDALVDVFVHDVRRGTTQLVSVNSAGVKADGSSNYAAPSVSNSGKRVAFTSYATNLRDSGPDANGFSDIFVRDLPTGTTTWLSSTPAGGEADGHSGDTAISPDGRLVTYWSYASNLIDPTDSIPYDQIVHDVDAGTRIRMLTTAAGEGVAGGVYGYFNSFSPNGRWFAVASNANDVVDGDTGGQWDVFLLRAK
jgi:Tol biopolymer transport system component